MFNQGGRRAAAAPRLDQYAQTVEQILLGVGVDPQRARMNIQDGFGWNFLRGSATIEIYVSQQEGAGYLQVLSPIIHLPMTNLLPLYRRLLELNLQLTNAALGVHLDVVYVQRAPARRAGRGRGEQHHHDGGGLCRRSGRQAGRGIRRAAVFADLLLRSTHARSARNPLLHVQHNRLRAVRRNRRSVGGSRQRAVIGHKLKPCPIQIAWGIPFDIRSVQPVFRAAAGALEAGIGLAPAHQIAVEWTLPQQRDQPIPRIDQISLRLAHENGRRLRARQIAQVEPEQAAGGIVDEALLLREPDHPAAASRHQHANARPERIVQELAAARRRRLIGLTDAVIVIPLK
ncbi:MAG: YbjN domain-containing protein [Anaerolineae bacterium]